MVTRSLVGPLRAAQGEAEDLAAAGPSSLKTASPEELKQRLASAGLYGLDAAQISAGCAHVF